MYNVQTLNKISAVGLSKLGEGYTYGDNVENPDAVLVRSASMHDMDMPESLLAIARAGAGVNNIPLDKCSEQGIVVFNTPGANANAVKELVLAGLLLSSRKIVAGIEWAKTLKGNGDAVGKMVEKGKSKFAGPEIKGKTLGVIGLGAIGALVANAAIALGMDVVGYDPFLSVDGALQLSRHITHVTNLDEIFAESDYITVHVPLTPDTKNIICAENIAKMKDGVRAILLTLLQAFRAEKSALMLQTLLQMICLALTALLLCLTLELQLPKVKITVLKWLQKRLRTILKTEISQIRLISPQLKWQEQAMFVTAFSIRTYPRFCRQFFLL